MRVFWPVILVVSLGTGLTVLLVGTDTRNDGDVLRAAYVTIIGTGILAAAAGRVILHQGWRTVHYGFVWSCVFAAMLVTHSFRNDIHRVVATVRGVPMQSVAMTQTTAETELRRGWDGHYRADAIVNGVGMRLMVDTGASMVLIPFEQASAIGIDPNALEFSVPVLTANGRSAVAPISIASITVGPIIVRDVAAAVAGPGKLQTGLLGMSFLDKLGETSFQGDRLFLRQGVTVDDLQGLTERSDGGN